MLRRIVKATPIGVRRIALTYLDGSSVVVDFSSMIRQGGIFEELKIEEFFSAVAIGESGRSISWPGELEFCADALWLMGRNNG